LNINVNSTYLGIDVGTQSVRVLCYDPDRRAVAALASAPLDLQTGSDGTREQQAGWWLAALCNCLAQIAPDIRRTVSAIGVSGQQHGFVALAETGEVLVPVKLWCDTSTTRECAEITAAFGGAQRCIADVGNAILPGYTAPKILWLKKYRPELYRRLDTILLPHDYINFHLTGVRAMEYGDASGTGLLDIRRRCWHRGMLRAVDPERDLADCLPPLLEPDRAVGILRDEVAAELGLPAGIPVSAGGGDNMMGAIGTGNVAAGRLTVSLGTSGTLFAYSDWPVIDEEGTLAAFCASTGGWLPLLCTMNCTVSTELTRDLFHLAVDELDRRISVVPAGSKGVMTLPFFNGERSPNLPNGKGCILGLDNDNYRPDNLMRSAMESAVYGLRAGLDAFRQQGLAIDIIRLTGGGSRSEIWCQMVADVFDLPVSVQEIDEGAALGAAMQACWMHRGGSLAELVDEQLEIDSTRVFEPVPETASEYSHHYQQFLRHVEAVTPLYA